MAVRASVVKRFRCPTDDRPCIRLYYNTTKNGTRVTESVPWAYCPDCQRVFPSPLSD
jgi:uncharacterized protein YbaR (Trm112 family)